MSVMQICDEEDVDHPNIVSESGRFITAHHSCVVTKVTDIIKPFNEDFDTRKKTGEHNLVKNMRDAAQSLSEKNFQEIFNDAISYREDCTNAFKLGILDLEERAKIETLYFGIIRKINTMIKDKDFIPEELQNLDDQEACQYLCNFSVFQSTADIWAIGQVLPVCPIARLDEEPTVSCTLADITCDSDGKIGQFIDTEEGIAHSLRLHELNCEPYYIGLFLTGAYQDVMGDMHNLFGRLNEVHVFSDNNEDNHFYIEEVIRGNTAENVLATMQYNPGYMAARVKKNIDKLVKNGKIPAQRRCQTE